MRDTKRETTIYDDLTTAALYADKRNRDNPSGPGCDIWTNEANQYTVVPSTPRGASAMRRRGWRPLIVKARKSNE